MKKIKLKKYAIMYIPKEDAFNVHLMKKGEVVPAKYKKKVQFIMGKSKADALKRLSIKSYKQETGRRL